MSFWAHRSRPNAQVTFSITAPAHPHATSVAVYPALFQNEMRSQYSLILEILSCRSFSSKVNCEQILKLTAFDNGYDPPNTSGWLKQAW